jgi:hypothetical protein
MQIYFRCLSYIKAAMDKTHVQNKYYTSCYAIYMYCYLIYAYATTILKCIPKKHGPILCRVEQFMILFLYKTGTVKSVHHRAKYLNCYRYCQRIRTIEQFPLSLHSARHLCYAVVSKMEIWRQRTRPLQYAFKLFTEKIRKVAMHLISEEN